MYDYLENSKKTRIALLFNILLLITALSLMFLLHFHFTGSLFIIAFFLIGQIVLFFVLNKFSVIRKLISSHTLISVSLAVILLRTCMTLAHAFLSLDTIGNYAALIVCLSMFTISLISFTTQCSPFLK